MQVRARNFVAPRNLTAPDSCSLFYPPRTKKPPSNGRTFLHDPPDKRKESATANTLVERKQQALIHLPVNKLKVLQTKSHNTSLKQPNYPTGQTPLDYPQKQHRDKSGAFRPAHAPGA
jgi:hypothetical protein